MSWIWTDDLARALLKAEGRRSADLGSGIPRDDSLSAWLHRPVAIRASDDDQALAALTREPTDQIMGASD